MNTLKIGIAGLGRIGKIHFANLCRSADVHVAGAMDVDESAQSLVRDHGTGFFTREFDELLTIPDLDAVVICSPTDTHADYILKAARAGKQIFCEKPIDLSLKTVRKVLNIVEESGVKLMLGFNRRFDPDFRKIHDLIRKGTIGNPQIIKITSRDPGPPPVSYIKRSGGLFLDMTIHDFDMARYISGENVKDVFARGAVKIDPAIEEAGDIDTAAILLTFEDGSMALIDNSRKAVYGYDQRLEVFGEKGMLMAENSLKDNHKLYNSQSISCALPMDFFIDRYERAYIEEMKAFIEALKENKEMPVSGNDGLMSLVIGLAAKQSVIENRLVKISEIHL